MLEVSELRKSVHIGSVILVNVTCDGSDKNIYPARSWFSSSILIEMTDSEYNGLKPCNSFGPSILRSSSFPAN